MADEDDLEEFDEEDELDIFEEDELEDEVDEDELELEDDEDEEDELDIEATTFTQPIQKPRKPIRIKVPSGNDEDDVVTYTFRPVPIGATLIRELRNNPKGHLDMYMADMLTPKSFKAFEAWVKDCDPDSDFYNRIVKLIYRRALGAKKKPGKGSRRKRR